MDAARTLDPFEEALLQVLARRRDGLGWYGIELRLSMMTIEKRRPLLEVLAALESRGLVRREAADTSATYRITEAGRSAITRRIAT